MFGFERAQQNWGVPTYPQLTQGLHHLLCEHRVQGQCRGGGTESQLATQLHWVLGRENTPNQAGLGPSEGNFRASGHGISLTSACYQWRGQKMARKNENKI